MLAFNLHEVKTSSKKKKKINTQTQDLRCQFYSDMPEKDHKYSKTSLAG